MNILRTALVTMLLTTGCTAGTRAQSEPSPADIVQAIQDYGSAMPVWGHVGFTACPQDDPNGRAVFEAVAGASISTVALRELSLRWSRPFRDCGYQPLEMWYQDALAQIVESADHASAFQFLSSLPPDINEQMRQILWRAVESGRFSAEVAGSFASSAVRATDSDYWINRTIAAFQDRRVPDAWVETETSVLLREHADAFLPALGQASGTLSDRRLTQVLSVVGAAVGRGVVTPSFSGLDALRAEASTRSGVPPHILDALSPR